MLHKFIAPTFFLLLIYHPAVAFVIQDIEVQGLERVSAGRFFSDLPLRVGDELDLSQSPKIINALYKTGLFDDIVLLEENGILIIEVVERPGISALDVAGNTSIPDEGLLEGLEQSNIAVGLVFDRLALERIKRGLQEQYYAIGKYGARVDADVTELPGNEVQIIINIKEGEVAKIRQIKISGNRRIKDKELLKLLSSGTKPWYKFWSGKDDYSQEKLTADLDTLQNLYFNQGYLDFNVDDTRVTLSPDKKDIFVEIVINEGGRYRVGDVALAGTPVLDESLLLKQISLEKGEYFSRTEALESGDKILFLLKDHGYAFANVVPLPQTQVKDGTVDVAFIIEPKKKTLVNRINISGNDTTSDNVLRREIRQMEGAEYSLGKIETSKRRLRRLPYLADVQIKDSPVSDKDDQVDLNVSVEERLSGNFNIGAGYSNASGAVVTFGLNQDNFLGTGNRVNFAFSNNESDTNYGIGIYNPFYTIDGISRSWNLSYRSVDVEERDTSGLISDLQEIKGALSFGVPLSENDSMRAGARLEDISLELDDEEVDDVVNVLGCSGGDNEACDELGLDAGEQPTANQIDNAQEDYEDISCIEDNDESFLNFILHSGFDYDTRDRSLFTTEGTKIDGSVQFYTPLSDSKYVELDYSQRHYFPLDEDDDFVFSARGRASYIRSYGSSCILYSDKFFAGGTKTVRGYANNSLGPQDSDGDSRGGNFRLIGNFDLIFPTDFLYDRKKLRMSLFTDIGNVFPDAEEFSASELRGSYGLQVQWLTALGAISFNIASQYGDDETDDPESFQFDLGTSF